MGNAFYTHMHTHMGVCTHGGRTEIWAPTGAGRGEKGWVSSGERSLWRSQVRQRLCPHTVLLMSAQSGEGAAGDTAKAIPS